MRPRAWPVFAVFAAALAFEFCFVFAIVMAMIVVFLWQHPSLLRGPGLLFRNTILTFLLGVTSGIGFRTGIFFLWAFVWLGAAFLGAAVSGEKIGAALRWRGARLTFAAAAAAIVGPAAWDFASFAAFRAAGAPVSAGEAWIRASAPSASLGQRAGLVIAFVLLGPACEPFYRGYAQGRFTRRWGARLGILAAAGLYSLSQWSLVWGVDAFFAGVYLGWVVERTGSVRWAMAAIALSNAITLALAAGGHPALADRPAFGACAFAVAAACAAVLHSADIS